MNVPIKMEDANTIVLIYQGLIIVHVDKAIH